MSRIHSSSLNSEIMKSDRIKNKAEAAETLSDDVNERNSIAVAEGGYVNALRQVEKQASDSMAQHRMGKCRNEFEPPLGDEEKRFAEYRDDGYKVMLHQFLKLVADLNGNIVGDSSEIVPRSPVVQSRINRLSLYSFDESHEEGFRKIIKSQGFVINDNTIKLTEENKRYLIELLDPEKAKEKMETLMQKQHEFTSAELKDETPLQNLQAAECVLTSRFPVFQGQKK